VEVSESACGEQTEEPDVDGNVDLQCRLKARDASAEVRALRASHFYQFEGKEGS
jgi:hypothetical protein